MDILFLKDITGAVHMYLSQVDYATCYHALSYLVDRSENTILQVVNGWMTYFGCPDEVIADAEGSFRGFKWENLASQSSVKLRLVPADSHWQLGKVERHGGTVKYMVARLVSQFSPVGAQELSLIVAACAAAKNSLMR